MDAIKDQVLSALMEHMSKLKGSKLKMLLDELKESPTAESMESPMEQSMEDTMGTEMHEPKGISVQKVEVMTPEKGFDAEVDKDIAEQDDVEATPEEYSDMDLDELKKLLGA